MRILVSCANGSGTSLMMMRSVEKAMKELGVPITKFIIAPFQKEKALLANTTLFYSSQFLQMFQQAEKRGVTVIGIKNVMSAKEIQEKYMASDRYQKSE